MGKGARNRRKRRELAMQVGPPTAPLHAAPPRSQFQFSCPDGECIEIEAVPANILTAVVPLIMRDGDKVQPVGTAFSIGHYSTGYSLYVTAKHVLETNLPPRGGVDVLAVLPAEQLTANGGVSLTAAKTIQIAVADKFADVALLAVDRRTAPLPVFNDLRSLPITFREPALGTTCIAVGFSDQAIGPLTRDIGSWSFKLRASQGRIEQIHEARRDKSMIDFPSFRTNAYYEHGMSGGPIIAQDGRALGVVSSSYDKDHATAYGAVLASIAELSIDMEELTGRQTPWSVKRLVEEGGLNVDAFTVTVHRSDDGASIEWVA